MGANSKIAWTDHTFNGWWGCTRVSAACDHCYAARHAERFGRVQWGHGEKRVRTSDENWRKPIQWNAAAAKRGVRDSVFCSSMADVFDTEVSDEWRDDLFYLIASTPNLIWQLLTKRPKVMSQFVSTLEGWPLPNVWLGVTAESQRMADMRIPVLLDTPAAARFISAEPLLEPLEITKYLCDPERRLDWVITGAESGPGRRPFDERWVRGIRDQCSLSSTAFFYKQIISPAGKKIETPELDGRRWVEFPSDNMPVVTS